MHNNENDQNNTICEIAFPITQYTIFLHLVYFRQPPEFWKAIEDKNKVESV